ncbi:MAG: hypothetical protein D6B26_00890 [Spirochaetaceae bacterium]|nr:MAG: hypothetical protein D6B26_00890 [Spirochaetaceae bacterium]
MIDDNDIKNSDEEKEIERHITELSQKGYQLMRQNFVQDAQTYFNKILEIDPTNNYALVGLGDAQRKRRQFSTAAETYSKCLEHHPKNNYALFGLADSLAAMRRYREAADIWERYLEHDDRNVTVLTRVADSHRKARNFRRAKELYDLVLELQEDNLYALIGLGHLHYDFKEYSGALQYWLRVLEITKSNPDIRILTSIGNCYRKMRRFSEGLPYFEMAQAKDGRNFYALFGLADCYRGLNEPEKALDLWDRLLKKEADNKVILTRAGDACRKMERFVEAERYYTAALEIEFDVYAVLGLAYLRIRNNQAEMAIETLEPLTKQDPHNHRFFLALSEAWLTLNKRKEAISALQAFLQQGLRHPSIIEALRRLE